MSLLEKICELMCVFNNEICLKPCQNVLFGHNCVMAIIFAESLLNVNLAIAPHKSLLE